MMEPVRIPLDVKLDTASFEPAIEKAKELNMLLEKASALADELAQSVQRIEVNVEIT